MPLKTTEPPRTSVPGKGHRFGVVPVYLNIKKFCRGFLLTYSRAIPYSLIP